MTAPATLLFALAATLVQQPAATTTGASDGSANLERMDSAGVTSPRLIRQVKADYTDAAIRARIQGVVGLKCIVERDGSVGPVRVVRSLDAASGLDEAAVAAVKQWRFAPGTKNGAPVRVEINVEMSFSLRSGPRPAAPVPVLAWPETFEDTSEVPGSRTGTWIDDSVQTSTASVRFAYPAGWSVVRSGDGQRLVTLSANTARLERTFSISEPGPAPFPIVNPLPESVLNTFFTSLKRSGPLANLQPAASGQVARDNGLWIWFELAAPTIDAGNAPTAVAEHLRTAHDGMRVWAFTTTALGQTISVMCTLLHAVGTSEAEKREEIRRAGLEFGAMLKRITIAPKWERAGRSKRGGRRAV
jgi:TonB family protein